MPSIYVDCTVCGSHSQTPYFLENGHTIVRCNSCGHVFENPLNVSEVHDQYKESGNWIADFPTELSDYQDHPRSYIYKFALGALQKYGFNKGRILEIGCSRGHFLQFMHSAGYECWGVEPGKDALAAQMLEGVKVIHSFVEDFNPKQKFQGIFLLDVLEHIPNPHVVLEKIFSLLSNPGIVVAIVPNFNIQQIRVIFAKFKLRPFYIILSPGNHINHFSPLHLKMFFERQPFFKVVICNSPIDLQYIRGLPGWWAPFKKAYWQVANIVQSFFGVQLAGSITAIALKSKAPNNMESKV